MTNKHFDDPKLNEKMKQLDTSMLELHEKMKGASPEKRKEFEHIWNKFESFAKNGVDGVKKGIPFFQQMMTNLQKKA